MSYIRFFHQVLFNSSLHSLHPIGEYLIAKGIFSKNRFDCMSQVEIFLCYFIPGIMSIEGDFNSIVTIINFWMVILLLSFIGDSYYEAHRLSKISKEIGLAQLIISKFPIR